MAGWRTLYDRATTIAAYANVPAGGPETCTCNTCRNWVQSRDQLFPPKFLALLERLGVAHDREAEVYHNGRLESGVHCYAGWYHFVGQVQRGEQEGLPDVMFGPFAVYFHSHPALLPEAFRGLSVAELEFEAQVPWLSDVPEAT